MAWRTLSKQRLVLLTVGVWAVVCVLYGYYYVVTILALPEPYDAYARNWQFQLMAFSLVRLPIMLLGLALLIVLEVLAYDLLKNRKK